jgi:hypothetical protein
VWGAAGSQADLPLALRNPIVKWPWAFSSLINSAALLLPILAAGDSQLQMRTARGLTATAHVNFRIVIPTVLSLDTGSGYDRAAGGRTVAIFSNSHNVALAATVRPLDAKPPIAGDDAHANVILNAAARKGIAQDAMCAPPDANARSVICTVSMP